MYFFESHIFSEALSLNVSVNVLLPQNIKPKEKVKALYLLHGYLGDHTDWMRLSAIERYANQYRIAIIMPAAQNSYYTDTTFGQAYFTFFSIELPKIIESIFPISKKSEDRMIGGLSMGGYGALKIALSKPSYFGKVFSLSGALDIEHIRDLTRESGRKNGFDGVFGPNSTINTKHDLKHLLIKAKNKKQAMPEIMIACGTEDFLIESNQKFHEFLTHEGIDHIYQTEPGVHDWLYWDHTIEKVLPWLNQ